VFRGPGLLSQSPGRSTNNWGWKLAFRAGLGLIRRLFEQQSSQHHENVCAGLLVRIPRADRRECVSYVFVLEKRWPELLVSVGAMEQ
jgi:hypothetical protein